ncbi:MAG: hypothetical protein KF749_18100 [Bacteroidetes bacterium]|nr:hypothetical protein [Bacteroidota bacterium]MCW5895192.1 hypothetical protein [Bacteroidota bacterium]
MAKASSSHESVATERVGLVESVSDPEIKTSVQRLRERVRGQTVIALLVTMLVIYIAPIAFPESADKMIPVSEKLLTALIGLLGTAIAFYFRNE